MGEDRARLRAALADLGPDEASRPASRSVGDLAAWADAHRVAALLLPFNRLWTGRRGGWPGPRPGARSSPGGPAPALADVNVQSLLGVIFVVGIEVSNTVPLTDFAENLRKAERLPPAAAIRRAAAVRARPVVMTALGTFPALVPMALGPSRGSEANVPLGRAVLGGLVAGLVRTLLVPCVYSLPVRNAFEDDEPPPGGAPAAVTA